MNPNFTNLFHSSLWGYTHTNVMKKVPLGILKSLRGAYVDAFGLRSLVGSDFCEFCKTIETLYKFYFLAGIFLNHCRHLSLSKISKIGLVRKPFESSFCS